MAHNIKQHDVVDATQPCWHGLETLCQTLDQETSRALRREIGERPIFFCNEEDGLYYPIEGYKEVWVPVNGGLTLNVAKDSYEIIQNTRVFEAVVNSLEGVDYEVTCIGTLDNWKRLFVSISLSQGQKYVINGDEFRMFLNIVTSHDGSLSLKFIDSTLRVVCQNTLNVALGEKRGRVNFTIKHTKGAEAKIERMEEAIDGLFQKRDEWYISAERLATIEMSPHQMAGFIAGTEYTSPEVGTRVRNRGREIARLAERGAGNKGETAYDLLNGYTDYWTHQANKSSKVSNFQSSDFGPAAQRKVQAFSLLSDDKARKETIERGTSILALMK